MALLSVDVAPLYAVFRIRLLTYRATSGAASLAETLAGGLNDVSDAYPRGAFRILNVRRLRNSDAPMFTAEVELTLYHRPQTEAVALEALADVANEALAGFVALDAGVFDVTPRDRDTAKRFSERADPEVVENVSTFDLLLFPAPTA